MTILSLAHSMSLSHSNLPQVKLRASCRFRTGGTCRRCQPVPAGRAHTRIHSAQLESRLDIECKWRLARRGTATAHMPRTYRRTGLHLEQTRHRILCRLHPTRRIQEGRIRRRAGLGRALCRGGSQSIDLWRQCGPLHRQSTGFDWMRAPVLQPRRTLYRTRRLG